MRIIVTMRASVKRCGLWRWPQQPCGAFASSFRAAGRAGGDTVTKVAEALESLDSGHDAPGRKDTEGVEATACTWVLPTLPGGLRGLLLEWCPRTRTSEVYA